jgi:hypothetical protein
MSVAGERKLRHAVLRFYREELRDRYQLDNIRRFSSFDEVSDTQIVELRDFFLQQIYPAPEDRERLDAAFDQLSSMLKSPKRMQPLLGSALTSLWRMGAKLPAAISAGRATIDAYVKTRVLENAMIEEALRLGLKPEDYNKRERMIHLLNAVPEDQVLQLIQDILQLFRALSNVEMLKVAVQFMHSCIKVMEKRPDLYTEEDLAGVKLGVELLQQGLTLFLDVKPNHFAMLVEGIEAVELDWYNRVREEAAA